ncbi:MAG: phosphoglucosamine mutase, partial [Nitrosopumilaceae archaeon]|nr:phosphoglucosamine mutase [Nitrosopumilaceae archaeon]
GKSLVHYLRNDLNIKSPKILIGKDTRLSGYMFEQALSAGFISMGASVYLVGPLPTPAIAYLTRNINADAGVVISASHNPYTDNGIKFFGYDGFKLEDKAENTIEDILVTKKYQQDNHTHIGKAHRIDDASNRYLSYLKNTFPIDYSLSDYKIVVDCANGAGYKVCPQILRELGAIVTVLSDKPDGKNINLNCGALYPKQLCEKVIDSGSDIGIALDGDADRCVFVDHNGKVVDGDSIIALCINEILSQKGLKGNPFVFTQMSNMALQNYVDGKNAKFILTDVGDKYVVDQMRKNNSIFGGEKSGHYVFMEHSTTGDGILSALQILSIMKKNNKSLSDLSNILSLYPQTLVNIKVKDKPPFEKIDNLNELLSRCKEDLGKHGRINLRYSGTEKLARVMVEGVNEQSIHDIASKIANIINKEIGANYNA